MAEVRLTRKQLAFCLYFVCGDEQGRYRRNAARAYMLAYGKEDTPESRNVCKRQAWKLRNECDNRRLINEKIAELEAEFQERLKEEVMALPIASVYERVRDNQRDLDRLDALIQEREQKHADYSETGLVVADVKDGLTVYKFDKTVIDSKLALKEATAKELGQRVEKKQIDVKQLTDEQLRQLLEEEAAAGGEGEARGGGAAEGA